MKTYFLVGQTDLEKARVQIEEYVSLLTIGEAATFRLLVEDDKSLRKEAEWVQQALKIEPKDVIYVHPDFSIRDVASKTELLMVLGTSKTVTGFMAELGHEIVMKEKRIACFEDLQFKWQRRLKEIVDVYIKPELFDPTPSEKDGPFPVVFRMKVDEAMDYIRERIEFYRNDPTLVESPHQLRVSIRTFRALISLVKKAMPLETYLAVHDIFRKKAAELAKLRETDVIIDIYKKKHGGEDDKLTAHLQKVRKEEEQRVFRLIESGSFSADVEAGYDLFVRSLDFTKLPENTSDVVRGRLDGWFRFVVARMLRYNEFDFHYIHSTRLKVKKSRYISEIFSDYINQTYKKRAKTVKGLQGKLGDVCDVIANQAFLQEVMATSDREVQEEALDFIMNEKERSKEYQQVLDDNVWIQEMMVEEKKKPNLELFIGIGLFVILILYFLWRHFHV
ncbi:CHAD domain-containing protein [Guggenheimella bovis]